MVAAMAHVIAVVFFLRCYIFRMKNNKITMHFDLYIAEKLLAYPKCMCVYIYIYFCLLKMDYKC